MSDTFSEERALSRLAHEPTFEEKRDVILVELHDAMLSLQTIMAELVGARTRIEDIDLVAQNPQRSQSMQDASYDEAIQVDNPYLVALEVRASRDGGGPVIIRVPPLTTRVVTARVREISLRALGNPAGATPATLIRFDKPQPSGAWPLGAAPAGLTTIVGSLGSGVADNGDGVVKVGGVQANGNRRVLAMDNLGQLIETLRDQTGISLAFENGSDGQTSGAFRLPANAVNLIAIDSANFELMRTPKVFKVVDNVAIGAESTIWTPAAGKKFRLMGYILTIDTATSPVKFRDGVAGTVIHEVRPTVNQAATPVGLGNGKLSSAVNNPLTIQAGAANNCHATVWGTEE